MKYFEKCKTLKEGTKRYRKLMMQLHPDHGGAHNEVIEMQRQFEVYVKTATRIEVEDTAPETGFATRQTQRSQEYVQTLQAVLGMNVDVECIGDFIWVFDSAPHDTLALTVYGFDYSKKHDGFYWTEIKRFKGSPDRPPRKSSKYQTDDLRSMFGSEEKRKKGYL